MAIELLNQVTCETWIQCLPQELYVELAHGEDEVHAIGVMEEEQPVAAACYEEGEHGLTLRSIYVLPDHRRKGYGRELLDYIRDQARAENMSLSVCFEWDEEIDIATLLPFLRAGGFQIELFELPLGVTDPETVRMTLEEWGAYKKMGGLREVAELPKRERNLLNSWLIDQTGEHLSNYLGPDAAGIVAMQDMELYGAVFFSFYPSHVRLDYCWVEHSHKQLFLPMLAAALDLLDRRMARDAASGNRSSDEKIEMILSTEQAIQIYTRLLDCDMEQIVLCMGKLEEKEYV